MTTPPSLLSVRMSAFRSCRHSSPIANHPRHVVERHALTSADGEAFVVVLPWGKKEELTALAGFHALATGFGEVREAVLLQNDEGKTFVEGGTHDGLLARGNGGGDEYGALSCGCQALLDFFLYLFFSQSAGALDLKEHGAVEEKAVADGGKRLACDGEASLHAEEVGVLSLHEEAAWVVAEVVEPALELPLAQEELVVEARGEEEAVGGVGVSLPGGWGR